MTLGLSFLLKSIFREMLLPAAEVPTGQPGNPRRGFPTEKMSHRDIFSPFLRYFKEISSSSKDESGLRPDTPPPFEKGGRKLLVQLFCEMLF